MKSNFFSLHCRIKPRVSLKRLGICLIVFAPVLMVGVKTTRAAGPWYVATTGNDTNDCLSIGTACLTIQGAVTKASAGDTINVAAGTYSTTGNTLITLDKAITLNGAQAGVDARTRGPNGFASAETVMPATNGPYVFYLAASDITIDGFMFPDMGPRGFDTYDNPDNFTVRNNIFKSTTGNSFGGNIQFGGGAGLHANNFLFEQNYVQNGGGGNMLYMGHAMDNGTIRNNYINGDNFAFGPFGARTGWLIEGNEFNGDVQGFGPYWGYGINANLGDVIIQNNYIHKMFVGLGQISVVGGTISGNTFDDDQFAALQLWGGEFGSVVSDSVTIQNNLIKYDGVTCTDYTDASHGVRLRPGLDPTTIHFHNNSFTDLGVGACAQAWAIRNSSNPALADATNNWWGQSTGPAPTQTDTYETTNPYITAYIDDPSKIGDYGFWPLPVPVPASKDQCKDNGWRSLFRADLTTFKNQGDCIQYVNTSK